MVKSYRGCKIFLILLTGFLLTFSSSSYSKPAVIVATINNEVITLNDLEQRIWFLEHSLISENKNLTKKSLIYNILDEMVEEKMVSQEASRVGIVVSEANLDSIIDQIKRNQPKLYKKLKSSGNSDLAIRIFRDKVKANITWSKILSEIIKPSIKNINKAQIIETLEQFGKNTLELKFNISHISIKESKSTKLIIEKIYDELIDNKETQEVLEIYKDKGILFNFQDIGWVSKSTLDSKIYDILILNKDKKYTKPILSNERYIIFKINKKILSNNISKQDYKLAENEIHKSLKISDGSGFLRNLRKRTFIEIYRERINKYLDLQ